MQMAVTTPDKYMSASDLNDAGYTIATQQLTEWVKSGKVRVVMYNANTLYSYDDVIKEMKERPRKTVYYTTGGVGNNIINKYDAVYGEMRGSGLFKKVHACILNYEVETLVLPTLTVLPDDVDFQKLIVWLKSTKTKLLILNEDW